MNFQELLAKMQAIDTAQDVPATECGEMPTEMNPMPMAPSMPPKQETPPPSMSVNINAQGMDNIEDMLKLMTKVNPDMINQPEVPPMPIVAPMMGPKPINKLIPDFDGDNDDMPGGEMDMDHDHEEPDADNFGGPSDHDADNKVDVIKIGGDEEEDSDEDEEDSDEDEEEKDEAYANEPDEDVRNVDYMTKKMSGGMNRMKGTHPKVAGGDNPMQRVKEGEDLRASIRAELMRALAETKGAK